MKTKQAMYFAGTPTEPDIRKIRETYPDDSLNDGDLIPYADIEKLIGAKRRGYRFQTVTSRWRSLVEKESGRIIGTKPAVGFVVLRDDEKVDLSGGKMRSAFRHARRSMIVSGLVDRRKLNDEQRRRQDHIDQVAARTTEAARLAAKAELPELTE